MRVIAAIVVAALIWAAYESWKVSNAVGVVVAGMLALVCMRVWWGLA